MIQTCLQSLLMCLKTQNGKKLTEKKWLQILGITERQLQGMLEPIAEHILNLFCYLNSGQLLENASSKQIENLVPCDVLDTFKTGQKPDTMTLLKLLVLFSLLLQNWKV